MLKKPDVIEKKKCDIRVQHAKIYQNQLLLSLSFFFVLHSVIIYAGQISFLTLVYAGYLNNAFYIGVGSKNDSLKLSKLKVIWKHQIWHESCWGLGKFATKNFAMMTSSLRRQVHIFEK